MQVADGRIDFRAHAAWRKLAVCAVLARLRQGHVVQWSLGRFVEVQRHPIDPGEHDQRVSMQMGREHGAGQILVDHGCHARPMAVVTQQNRHTATAAGDRDDAGIEQRVYGFQIQDFFWLWACHHAAPTAAGVFSKMPPGFVSHLPGLCLAEEFPHRLGRRFKGGVVGIHLDLGDDAGHHQVHALINQHIGKALLQHVAHTALRMGHANIHGHGRELVGGTRHAVQNIAHHRPIAVGEHQLPTGPDDLDQVRANLSHECQLFLGRALDGGRIGGITAQCDHHALARCQRAAA